MNYPNGYQIADMTAYVPVIAAGQTNVTIDVTKELVQMLFGGVKPIMIANLHYTDGTTQKAVISGFATVTETGTGASRVRSVKIDELTITNASTNTAGKIKITKG